MQTSPDASAPTDGVVSLQPVAPRPFARFALRAADGRSEEPTEVGTAAVDDLGDGVGELTLEVRGEHQARGYAVRGTVLLVRHAFDVLGLERVQAHVEVGNGAALRVASRAGLRREGVLRARRAAGSERRDLVVLARLAGDPEPDTRAGFIGLVNASLPRKRVIAHAVIRDAEDRVLLCETTYKSDWELPGGVVEPGESPEVGVDREVTEELGVELPIGGLLDIGWLPPWKGWDDALALLYDGGQHDGPALLARCALQPREIRAARFCDVDELRRRTTPVTHERVLRALAEQSRVAGR